MTIDDEARALDALDAVGLKLSAAMALDDEEAVEALAREFGERLADWHRTRKARA